MSFRLDSKAMFALKISLVAMVLSLGMCMRANAQVAGGNVLGTITDPSGGTVPMVEVSIRNLDTSVVTKVTTNSDGFYSAPNILPGNYEITASATGFSSAVANVTVTVGGEQRVNIPLKVGQMSEHVEVSDVMTTVELASSEVSGEVTRQAVVELPLNGRSWTDLATLEPGVGSIRTQADPSTPDRANRGWGNQLAISGMRPTQNIYRLNGININDSHNSGPGSILGGNLGVDAIGEFSVLTSNSSSQYGNNSGGVINAITKSGANALHGDVYEFLRNSALDARNFFDGPKVPTFRRNQFGAAAGGAIKKDKLFYFVDYEGLRQSLALSQVGFVPSPAARAGNLTSGSITVSPLVQPYLKFFPLPNGAVNGDTGKFSFAGSQVSSDNFVTGRIDYKLSEKDSLFGTYLYDHAPSTQNDVFDNDLTTRVTTRQVLTLEESHVFNASLVNTLRFGASRDFAGAPVSAAAINPLLADKSLGFVPGYTAGDIQVPGLTLMIGLAALAPSIRAHNSFQGYDDAFLTKGNHSLKFGFDIQADQINSTSTPRPGGIFIFSSLHDWLTDAPGSSISSDLPGSDGEAAVRQMFFGGYIQDDIHLTRRLTVNAGLRYETVNPAWEKHNKSTGLVNISDAFPVVGSGWLMKNNPTRKKGFQPRLGFAWDAFGNGKTAVRGGFGMFDVLPLAYEVGTGGGYPFLQSGNGGNLPQDAFPFQAIQFLSSSLNSKRVGYFESNPPLNYVMQWHLSVEHQLTRDLSATISYVGTRAIHNLMGVDDGNIVLPIKSTVASAPGGWLWPCEPFVAGVCQGIGSGSKLNCCVGREPSSFWNSHTMYDALQILVQKKLSHGLQIQGAFTWSHGIDTASGNSVDPYTNSLSSTLFYFDQSLRKGPSDTNSPRTAVLSYTWLIPSPHSFTGAAGWATNGWQFGGILTLSDGVPFTPLIAGDPLGLNSSAPSDYPDRLGGSGCQSLINPGNVDNYIKLSCYTVPQPVSFNGVEYVRAGNMGRNSIYGPGLAEFDLSLFKNNYIKKISETFNAQFRFEAFNIFNRANFAPPTDNSTLFNPDGSAVPNAGAIDATVTTSRQLQFALKVIW
jgi:hypothetical protein